MKKALSSSVVLLVVGLLVSPTEQKKGFGPGEQDWGFVDVRPGAHMFYWLFYVQDPKVSSPYDKPLVMWLQGGPGGSSSAFGNFEEIGPLFVNGSARPHSWAKHVNLVFVDNPVGAGYSYVDSIGLLTKTNAQIGKDMVSFLTGFCKKHPEFEKSPFYIYSESYGGKMTVEISKQLLEAISKNQIKMNFKGVGLGDSWISPVDSVNTWAPFLFSLGVIDPATYTRLSASAKKIEEAVKNGKYDLATDMWGTLEVQIMKETANVDFYNVMYKVKPVFPKNRKIQDIEDEFGGEELEKLMDGPVKKALGLPTNVKHNSQSSQVFQALRGDFMKPVITVVEDLLNNTNLQVVVFTGNLDLIVDTPGTVVWLENMKWKGASQWKVASQKPILINGYIEGYVKNVGSLYLYTILRAGHMVPTDNPPTALEILRRSTRFDQPKL